jgi:hypothetical protein
VEYVHIPGTQNVIVDGMSRIPARYFDLGATHENVDEKKGKKIGKKHGGLEPANGKVEEVFAVTLEEQKNCEKMAGLRVVWMDCAVAPSWDPGGRGRDGENEKDGLQASREV